MENQALFIATGNAPESTTQVTRAAAGASLKLEAADDTEAGLHRLRSLTDARRAPAMVLIGPAPAHALDAAQAAHRLAPLAHIVFVADPQHHEEFRQTISEAAMIGDYWSVADITSPRLADTLDDIARDWTRRQQLRGTLDKFNRQLARQRPALPSRFRKLLVSEKYLGTVLSTTPDAIIASDSGGEVVAWNRGAAELFKIPEAQALGRTLDTVAGGDWPRRIRSALEQLRGGRQSVHLEIECPRPDDRGLYIDLSVSALYEGGAMRAACIVARDITERRRAEQTLRAANEELERSNLELQQFAYIASHDLQSPLRSISGFLQLLQQEYTGKLDEQAEQWIRFTVQNVTQMQTLIGDLLKYSRIDSRARPFGKVDMNEVMDNVTTMLDSSIQDSNAQITRDELPVVLGDHSQLAQLLMNLISNAIKYQGEAPPRVHVGAERREREWLLSVRDNGMGISHRHRERIFEIFRRLHTTRTHPGTGIGLAICRRVVTRHGGRIWVESTPGDGSTFFFTIPDKEPQTDDQPAA